MFLGMGLHDCIGRLDGWTVTDPGSKNFNLKYEFFESENKRLNQILRVSVIVCYHRFKVCLETLRAMLIL